MCYKIARCSRSDIFERKREVRICADMKPRQQAEGPKLLALRNYSTGSSHGAELVRDNFKLILTFI